jgi:Asp-tRNA(Asn)/Glu-tRNA(Gln) amidotransferase C subunit
MKRVVPTDAELQGRLATLKQIKELEDSLELGTDEADQLLSSIQTIIELQGQIIDVDSDQLETDAGNMQSIIDSAEQWEKVDSEQLAADAANLQYVIEHKDEEGVA